MVPPLSPPSAGSPARRSAAAAGNAAWVGLPFAVALGPHRLRVEWREPSRMSRSRAAACVDLEAGCIALRQDLTGLALAEAFFGCVLWLAHRRRLGLGSSLDESASHRLATGLVEFAWRSPGAWLWFNLLLSRHLPGAPGFDAAVRGALPRPPPVPVGLRRDLRECIVGAPGDPVPGSSATVRAIELINQRLLRARGLGPRSDPTRVLCAERAGWLALIQSDPDAWRWLVWSISGPAGARSAQR